MVEIFLIHLGEIAITGGCIGFWHIPENLADIPPDEKRAAGDDCTLVPDPNWEAVNMMMAEVTDDKDSGRGIPYHLPVHAPA